MMANNAGRMAEWKELARILEVEWRGQSIDPGRACALAQALLPQFPELTRTLTHIRERMDRATH